MQPRTHRLQTPRLTGGLHRPGHSLSPQKHRQKLALRRHRPQTPPRTVGLQTLGRSPSPQRLRQKLALQRHRLQTPRQTGAPRKPKRFPSPRRPRHRQSPAGRWPQTRSSAVPPRNLVKMWHQNLPPRRRRSPPRATHCSRSPTWARQIPRSAQQWTQRVSWKRPQSQTGTGIQKLQTRQNRTLLGTPPRCPLRPACNPRT